jgi:hypothetical protein
MDCHYKLHAKDLLDYELWEHADDSLYCIFDEDSGTEDDPYDDTPIINHSPDEGQYSYSSSSYADESFDYICIDQQDEIESIMTGFSLVQHEDENEETSQWTALENSTSAAEEEEDISFVCISNKNDTSQENETSIVDPRLNQDVVTTCAICLESDKTLVRLMKNCRHPQACYDCLRTHYILNAQRGITPYPLQCYWPGCHRILCTVQVQKLVQTENELHQHYLRQNEPKRLKRERNKAKRMFLENKELLERRAKRLVTHFACTGCHQSTVMPLRRLKQRLWCRWCGPTLQSKTARLQQNELQQLLLSVGDNLINCPNCLICLVKEGGCDQMTCICGARFRFDQVRQVLDTPGIEITDPYNPYKGWLRIVL